AHEAGLGYRWMGRALGGRSRPGAAQFAAAVDEVAALAAGGPVALLCAETDPASCHRSLVLAPALEARGATVWHILPDGTAAPHQPPLGLEDPS
ncbi:MAG TPA: DUF488 domain-containing protein, partial [Gemmatimonadales bacterium]|nr:DUF488 domain-containing protein [Gemmatimonadales bacterium]